MTRRRLFAVLIATQFLFFSGAASAEAAPGDLDPSFGKHGVSRPRLGPSSGQIAFDTVRQADGKFVLAGRTSSGGAAIVARYLADGSLDGSFGNGGFTEFEGIAFDGLTLDSAGRIVLAGHDGDRAVVARLKADGTPDGAFGVGGFHSTRFAPDPSAPGDLPENPRMGAVEVLADGSIYAAGRGSGCSGRCQFALTMRTDPDGAPLPLKGRSDGTAADQAQSVTAIDLLPDGRLVQVTRFEYYDGYYNEDRWTVKVFDAPTPEGKVERRWQRIIPTEPFAPIDGGRAIATEDGGFLLASGSALYKGLADGPDVEFGEKGLAGFDADLFALGRQGRFFQATDVATEGDGDLLVAGVVVSSRGSRQSFVARLDSRGVPDPTFDNDGISRQDGWTGRVGKTLIPPRVLLVDGRYVLSGTGLSRGAPRFEIRAIEGGSVPVVECDGRPATWIGTDRHDFVSVDGGVIATGGGRDEIRINRKNPSTVVCSGTEDDSIRMNGGEAFGGPGDDRIRGNDRPTRSKKPRRTEEVMHGGPGRDRMEGLGGDDRLFGDGGADVILGGAGDDDLFGGSGRDEIEGEGGNDHLTVGPGRDRLDGGPSHRPRSYYAGSLGRNRAEFTRVGGKLVFGRIFTVTSCSGNWSASSWNPIRKSIPIGPGGRIRYEDSSPPDYVEELRGRLRGGVIRGRYMSTYDDYFDSCSTGSARNPWVRFRAGFERTRVQFVRP